MDDRAATRRLTTLFPLFLGLRLVPPGVWFLSLALPLPGEIPHPIHLGLLPVAAVSVAAIHRWYRQRYGVVEAERLRLGRSWVLAGGLAAAYLALAGGAGRLAPRSLVLVLALILFAAGAGWALPRIATGPRRMAAIVVIAALAATLLVALPTEPAGLGSVGWLFSLALGLVLCAAGWAEHRGLREALPGAAGSDDV